MAQMALQVEDVTLLPPLGEAPLMQGHSFRLRAQGLRSGFRP